MERTLENALNAHLLSSLCYAEGTVTNIRNSNPFTKSKRITHKWMILLTNVTVGGLHVDHIWIFGCKRVNKLREVPRGTRVTLTGHVGLYEDKGEVKWTLNSPFRNITIL